MVWFWFMLVSALVIDESQVQELPSLGRVKLPAGRWELEESHTPPAGAHAFVFRKKAEAVERITIVRLTNPDGKHEITRERSFAYCDLIGDSVYEGLPAFWGKERIRSGNRHQDIGVGHQLRLPAEGDREPFSVTNIYPDHDGNQWMNHGLIASDQDFVYLLVHTSTQVLSPDDVENVFFSLHLASWPEDGPEEPDAKKQDADEQDSRKLKVDLRTDARIGGVVRALFEDSRGVVWIGGEGDLFRIDPQRVTSFDLKDDQGQRVTVKQIVETSDGAIWCGTTGGITRIQGDSFVSYGPGDGLISRDVWSLAADGKGTLWIGTLDGVCCFDGKKFSSFALPKSRPDLTRGVTSDSIVHCIAVDTEQRIWFGTNGGAYVYDGSKLTRISQEDGLPGDVVHNILQDSAGHMWFGTTHHGISRFDGQNFQNFTADGVVEGEEIWSLNQDQRGAVWFSGKGFGVYRFDGKEFVHFEKKDGLKSAGLMCLMEDSRGRTWLGGAGGLFRYQDGRFIQIEESGPWE